MQFKVETDRLFLRTMVSFTAHIAEEPRITKRQQASLVLTCMLIIHFFYCFLKDICAV